eukprot:3744542-Pyramimonas_sp.AAC.1
MSPALSVLGDFFQSSRRFGEVQESSVMALIETGLSPVRRCLVEYFNCVSDEASPCWLPLLGSGPWSPVNYRMASVPMLCEIGSLYHRFVDALDSWPWRLARLLDPDAQGAEKGVIADA